MTNIYENKEMTVQEMIDLLVQIKDKSMLIRTQAYDQTYITERITGLEFRNEEVLYKRKKYQRKSDSKEITIAIIIS